jgi:hypothetical protein
VLPWKRLFLAACWMLGFFAFADVAAPCDALYLHTLVISRYFCRFYVCRPENAVKNAYYAALRRDERRRKTAPVDSAAAAAAHGLSALAQSPAPVTPAKLERRATAPAAAGESSPKKRKFSVTEEMLEVAAVLAATGSSHCAGTL